MSAHNLDPQHLLQQMLSSPGGQVPPELAGLLAKLGSGSQAGALGALQRQLSSLFSATTPEQRIATAADIARKIEAGYTFINAHGPSVQDGNGPFGGFKKSGIGRNFGYEGVVQFQGYHSIAGVGGSLLS